MAAVMAGAGLVVELEILAEHGKQVLFQPHHQLDEIQVSKITFAPSQPIWGE